MSRRIKFALGPCVITLAFLVIPTPFLAQGSRADEVERSIQKLKDPSWQIRWNAAALGETKDPRAIGPLKTALKDENSYVRMTAARSL